MKNQKLLYAKIEEYLNPLFKQPKEFDSIVNSSMPIAYPINNMNFGLSSQMSLNLLSLRNESNSFNNLNPLKNAGNSISFTNGNLDLLNDIKLKQQVIVNLLAPSNNSL